jgi:hypothetical protein
MTILTFSYTCKMQVHPTFQAKEALLLMCELDLEGLELLWQVITEEKASYSDAEIVRVKKVYKYCMLTEKRNKGLL